MRYLFAAVWIAVFLPGCGGSEPVVGTDDIGDQPAGESGQLNGEDDQPVGQGNQGTGNGDQQTGEGERTEEGDRARLVEMRQEIDALVGDAAGTSIADCRYAGLGAKPCGGPWGYVIYSVSSTDSSALARRLMGYDAFEAEMNGLYGYVSDCSVPAVPVLAYRDGRCVAE